MNALFIPKKKESVQRQLHTSSVGNQEGESSVAFLPFPFSFLLFALIVRTEAEGIKASES